MKTFTFFMIFLTWLSACFSATSVGFFHNPKFPGKCTISDKFILATGDVARDPDVECGRVMCAKHGVAHFDSCSPMNIGPGCKLGDFVDVSRDYPECCERKIVCESFLKK